MDPTLRQAFDSQTLPASLSAPLERLRAWGNTPLPPVLLEILLRYQAKTITPKVAGLTIAWIESFVVRRYANQVPPNDLRSVFARIAGKLHSLDGDGVTFVDALKAELSEPARRWPSNSELRTAFKQRPMYRKRTNTQTFLILKRLAEAVGGKAARNALTSSSDADPANTASSTCCQNPAPLARQTSPSGETQTQPRPSSSSATLLATSH